MSKENLTVYKMLIDKESLSPRVIALSPGDTIFINSREPVTIGDKYKSYPAQVVKVFYEPRKWWQFFKKKEQIGFLLRWI